MRGLNLPAKIELENNKRIYYLYDAAGTKLRKYYYEDSRLMTTTDYSGPFVYTDHHPDYILTTEGRLKWDDHDSLFHPEYFIKDHLGNVRVVLTTNPNQHHLSQITDYYPFGMEIPVSGNSDNQLKYNGKELQMEAKLEWYDYGARFYDPALARFHTIDLLAEDFSFQSSFAYAANNPIRYIDWMGMGPGDPPAGTTQIYFKFSASFGPQLGFKVGDIISGTLRAANVVGETKVGLTISPEGKIGLLFEQDSKNVNYEMEGSIPVIGGKLKSSEFGTDEHPTFAVEKTETQKGLVKETKTESEEKVTSTESTSYEVGLGINAIMVGVGGGVGFEHVVDTKTEIKPDKQEDNHK